MKLKKRIAAMSAAVVMMVSMSAIGASAYNTSDSYNKLYYAGNETTTNYYVTYSKGTNCSGSSKFHIVSSIVYSTSNSQLASNSPSGVTANNAYRDCYANVGASNVYRSYHRSILRKSTSYSDGTLSYLDEFIYY